MNSQVNRPNKDASIFREFDQIEIYSAIIPQLCMYSLPKGQKQFDLGGADHFGKKIGKKREKSFVKKGHLKTLSLCETGSIQSSQV